jgi:tetratricopeptide (TPR) repeat protein
MTDVGSLLEQGKSAQRTGDWDKAIEVYEKALKSSPDSFVARRNLASMLAIRGRLKAIIATYRDFLSVMEAREDYPDVIEVIDLLLTFQPESEDLYSKKIEIYWRMKDTAQAVALTREVAHRAFANGDEDRALDLLEKAYKEDGQNLDLGMQLAEAYLGHGQMAQAQTFYRKIAGHFLEHNELGRAAETYKRLTVVTPNDMSLHLILGDLYTNLGSYPDAEQHYRTMLKSDLTNVEALLGLARVSQFKGQFRDAILALNRITNLQPDEIRALDRLGEVYREQGLTADSIKYYTLAGLAAQEAGAARQAQRFFELVLEMDPMNNVAICNLPKERS